MSGRIEDGRGWRPSSVGLFVLPAMVVLIGLVGVTSGPLLEVREARTRHRLAEELLGEYQGERQRLDQLRSSVDPEHIEAQVLELDALLPGSLVSMEAHTLLRLASRASGLAIEAIELGTLYDLVAVIDAETVYMQDVRISAQAQVADVVRFVHTLRERGFPTVVHDLSLTRSAPGATSLATMLHLGLLYRGAPPTRAATGAGQRGEQDQDQAP